MSRKAFTLVEILITLSIISIIISITVITLPKFTAQISLNAEAKTLVSDLRQLQAKAKTTHQTQTLGTVSFASSGYPLPGSVGTIVLKNKFGQTKKVVISSAGRIRYE